MAGVLPLVLTACGGSTVARPLVLVPSPSLLVACAAPVALPDRALTQAEAEIYWGRDRTALRACGGQVSGLATWLAQQPGG